MEQLHVGTDSLFRQRISRSRQEEKFKTADNGHPPDRLSRHSGNLSRFELTEKPTTDT